MSVLFQRDRASPPPLEASVSPGQEMVEESDGRGEVETLQCNIGSSSPGSGQVCLSSSREAVPVLPSGGLSQSGTRDGGGE